MRGARGKGRKEGQGALPQTKIQNMPKYADNKDIRDMTP